MRELGRLQQLVELAYDYDREISLRTDAFADFVAAQTASRILAPQRFV